MIPRSATDRGYEIDLLDIGPIDWGEVMNLGPNYVKWEHSQFYLWSEEA